MGRGKTYTAAENNFLREVYPGNGARVAYELFQKKFCRTPGWQGFKSHLSDLGLKVTNRRWREACQNNGERTNVPIGTIVKRGRGANFIKVADGTKGWVPLAKHLTGSVGKDELVVHLDGDKANDDVNNLMIVNRKTTATLTGCGMWSENAEITRTAIIWCELKQEYEKQQKAACAATQTATA